MITPDEIEGKSSFDLHYMASEKEEAAEKLTRDAEALRRMAERKQVETNMPELVAGLLERDKKRDAQMKVLREAIGLIVHALKQDGKLREDFDPLKDWAY